MSDAAMEEPHAISLTVDSVARIGAALAMLYDRRRDESSLDGVERIRVEMADTSNDHISLN